MADKRIIELTNEKLTLGDGDYTIVDSNEGTYKYKLKRIVDSIPAPDTTLSIAGRAADAKAVGDEIAGVKRDLSEIMPNVFSAHPVISTTGLSGARMTSTGSVPSSSFYDVTSFIPVGDYGSFSVDYSLSPIAGYGTIVIGYFSNDAISSANMVGYVETGVANKKYDIPSGARYIALTCPTGTHPTLTFYESRLTEIESRVGNIEVELNEVEDIITSTHYSGMRYKVENGVLSFPSSSLFDVVNLTPIADEITSFSLDYTLTPPEGYGTVSVCFFSAEPESTSNLIDYITSVVADKEYSIPSGTKYIGLMVETGSQPTISLHKNRLDVIENNLGDLQNAFERGTVVKTSTMETNDSISATVGNLKKNTVLSFNANISTFGSLQIGQGRTSNNETAYLVINDSTVKVYGYTGSQAVEIGSYNHGLTIADYIDVCIEESNDELGYAKIRITSNGQTYMIDRVMWMGCNSSIYADAISGSYTNCQLSFYCADYEKEFWLFGDSYFDHWVTHCLEDGHNNFLCDGFSGRKSDDAYTSLLRNLNHGKPNTIVWCIGMNNGDTASAVNATWETYYTMLKKLCEEKGINLILCTIPNVASVNNNYKNAIIRASGYRYIELAKAVGSDISTSWYTRLLSSDQVHPSTLGDEMIARFMESAIPEITK